MKKNLGVYFLCGIIVILLIKIIWFSNGPETKIELPKEAKEAVNADVTKVTKTIDEKGFEHAVISDKENVIQSFFELDDSTQRKLDSVTKLLGIERKQFREWRQYNTSISAKDLPALKTDTGFYYKDKYAFIEFVKPKDSLSKEKFNFSYNAEINYVEYYKKNWFLGAKKQYIDFWIADPRATVNGVKRIKIEPKSDNLKVEVNASAFYTDRANVGVDAGLTINRTRIGGGYYYDTFDKQWKSVFSVKFKLWQF